MHFHRLIIFSLFIAHLTLSAYSQPLSAVWPKPGMVTPDFEIEFAWNLKPGTLEYTLQASSNPGFSSLVFSIITPGQVHLHNFLSPGIYYWRVGANPGDGNIIWSQNYAFTIFSPEILPNVSLWLDAGEAITTPENRVSQWTDKSGQGNHVIQVTPDLRPQRVAGILNGRPVVRFDGVNDFLDGGNILNLGTSSRTALVIGRNTKTNGSYFAKSLAGSAPNRYALIYENSRFTFLYQDNSPRIIVTTQAPGSYEYITAITSRERIANEVFINGFWRGSGILNQTYNLWSDFNFLVGGYNSTTGGLPPFSGFFLQGDIAEIIIINAELSPSQRYDLEEYVRKKYFPAQRQKPVDLGFDKNQTTLCAITLDAGPGYASYLWNTGETSQTITVNQPGTYNVTVTNIFGLASGDAIEVNFPNPRLNLQEAVICLGEEITLSLDDTDLGGMEGYSLLWSNGQTTPSITVGQAGVYTLTVTDNFGCARVLSANVTVDRFSETASLGEDRPFCLGAELALMVAESKAGSLNNPEVFRYAHELAPGSAGAWGSELADTNSRFGGGWWEAVTEAENIRETTLPSSQINTNKNAITYLWSNGETTPAITITQVGTYWVEAINANGCLVRDTVTLSFQGFNPTVAFEADPVCPQEEMEFFDLSSVPDGSIISWRWDFGDGFTSAAQHPVHVLQREPGISGVSLTVVTDAGCVNAVRLPVQVFHEPEVHFTPNHACSGVPVSFTDQSIDPDGFGLSAWEWDFGPLGIITAQNPSLSFPEAGSATVALKVTSQKGCSSSLSRTLTIRQSPLPAFEWTNACQGEPMAFADLSTAPAWVTITGRHWNLGDGTTTTRQNPTHLYPAAGEYPVTLTLTALNGCTISLTQPVRVHSLPQVNFNSGNICARTPHTFTDHSTVPHSHISAWHWTFGTQGSSAEQHPSFSFAEAGQQQVGLVVTSAAGCTAAITRTVQVNPKPEAAFGFTPRYGVAPLNVTFINNSQGAATYIWDFGDGSAASALLNPIHTYLANGVYFPGLVAMSAQGCADTTRRELKVIPTTVDVALSHLAYSLQGGFMEVRVNLLNLGTRDLDTLWLDLHLAGTNPIRERWTGLLRGGAISTHTMSVRLPVTNLNDHDYLCLQVSGQGPGGDLNPANNRICLAFSNGFRLLGPRPNPAMHEVTVAFILPFEGPVDISLYDLSGNLLLQRQSHDAPAGLNFVNLPMHNLQSGTYFVRVTFSGNTETKKVLKL